MELIHFWGGAFLPLFDRTVVPSWDSNSGHPKHNGAICRHAAHEATATDNTFYFYFDKMMNKKCLFFIFITYKGAASQTIKHI